MEFSGPVNFLRCSRLDERISDFPSCFFLTNVSGVLLLQYPVAPLAKYRFIYVQLWESLSLGDLAPVYSNENFGVGCRLVWWHALSVDLWKIDAKDVRNIL